MAIARSLLPPEVWARVGAQMRYKLPFRLGADRINRYILEVHVPAIDALEDYEIFVPLEEDEMDGEDEVEEGGAYVPFVHSKLKRLRKHQRAAVAYIWQHYSCCRSLYNSVIELIYEAPLVASGKSAEQLEETLFTNARLASHVRLLLCQRWA